MVPSNRVVQQQPVEASPRPSQDEAGASVDREVEAEFERTLQKAGRLDSASEAIAWVVDKAEGRWRLAARWRPASAAAGIPAAAVESEVALEGASLLAEAAAGGRVRSMRELDRIAPSRLALRSPGVFTRVSLLPVVAGGEPMAVLLLLSPGGTAPDYRIRRSMERSVGPLGQALLRQRRERGFALERQRLHELVAARAEQARQLDARLHEAERWAMVGGFAAGLLHDLTNTLMPLQCGLEVLESEPLGPVARSQVDAMALSLVQLRRLVRDLRDLAGGGVQRSGRTSVRSWWRRERRAMRERLPAGVSLTGRISTQVAAVAISPARLQMIFTQILENAARAIGAAGSVAVSVDLEPGEGTVRFEVADDGEGMSDAVRRRATEPFFTTKPRQFGTGLGLSLVRSLLEAGGGSMEIDSAPGRGTRVVFRVPIAATPASRSQIVAVVAVAEPRLAGFIEHVLRRRGAVLADRLPEEGSWLLVAGDEAADAEWIRGIVGRRFGGGVLVVGAMPEPPQGKEWRGAPPMRSVDATDVVAVKNGLEAMFDQLSGG